MLRSRHRSHLANFRSHCRAPFHLFRHPYLVTRDHTHSWNLQREPCTDMNGPIYREVIFLYSPSSPQHPLSHFFSLKPSTPVQLRGSDSYQVCRDQEQPPKISGLDAP